MQSYVLQRLQTISYELENCGLRLQSILEDLRHLEFAPEVLT